MQVLEVLRKMRGELLSRHDDAVYAELLEKVEVGGALAIANVQIFGHLISVSCEEGVLCCRKPFLLGNQHLLIYISYPFYYQHQEVKLRRINRGNDMI